MEDTEAGDITADIVAGMEDIVVMVVSAIMAKIMLLDANLC